MCMHQYAAVSSPQCVGHEELPLVVLVSYCNYNGSKMQDMIIDVIILSPLEYWKIGLSFVFPQCDVISYFYSGIFFTLLINRYIQYYCGILDAN